MKKYLCAVCLLLTGAALTAQQDWQFTAEGAGSKRTISVEDAVSLALKNNLSLQATSLGLEKKRRPSAQAWNQFLPTVGLTGSLGASNTITSTTQSIPAHQEWIQDPADPSSGVWTDIPAFSVTNKTPRWSLSAGFQVQWQGLNIAMFEGIKQLKLSYEAGKISYAKAKLQMERDVRKLYANILLAEKNLEVQERSFALSEEQVKTATANFRAGLSPELNLLQARLNRDNMVPTIEQYRNNIKISKANLALLMGIPFDANFDMEPLELSNLTVIFNTSDLIRTSINNKIDIQEMKANINAMKSARNAIRYQLWTPSLGISWGLAPAFQGDPFADSWDSDHWKDGGRLSLSLSWSLNGLLPFTTQAASLNDMNDDLRVLDTNLAQLVRATELDVYNTVFLIEQARDSAAAQEKTVELARKTYTDTLTAFRSGTRDLLEVQNVEQQLRQAQLGVLQQQFNFMNGITDLEYAIGVPFGSLKK